MGFSFIREGDSTSHGGRVLTCTPDNKSDGKAIALLGDMVSCPRCKGVFPIVKVKPELHVTFGGRPVASEGDLTACGATLIASQSTTTASPAAGSGGPVGVGMSVLSQLPAQDGLSYRGRFQLLDDNTRQPIPNHPYTVTSADGQTVEGETDANGYTDWLNNAQASSLMFSQPGTAGVSKE